ncbi:MAG: NDP-sugar synthase [Chloroflexota bacterium]
MIDSAVILAVSSKVHASQLKQQRPRAMLPALGKPMVVRVMDRLYRAGIRQYVVIVGIDDGAIASYVKNQWMPDAKVSFILQSRDSLTKLMVQAANMLERPFMVAGYNSFTLERYIRTLIKRHNDDPDALFVTGAGLTLSPDAPSNHYATTKGGIIDSIGTEKPPIKHYVLAETSICGREVVSYLQGLDEDNLPTGKTWFEVLKSFVQRGDVPIKVSETSWILRVESDANLLTLNKRLLDDSNDGHVLSELPYSVKVHYPIRVDPSVSVGQEAELGPHVYIERGSSVGYGARIKNAVVLENASVPADSDIDGAIVTSGGIIDL